MPLENLDDLEAEWAEFIFDRPGSRSGWSQDQKWRADNPGKRDKLLAYRADRTKRPNEYEQAERGSVERRMLEHLDAWWEAKGVVTPPPPPTTYTVAQSVTQGQALSGYVAWSAVPSDVPGTAKVEFFINGNIAHTEGLTPYEFGGDGQKLNTANLPNGSHTLSVKATATDGRVATASAVVNVSNIIVVPTPTGTTPDGNFKLGDQRRIIESWHTPMPDNPEVDPTSAQRVTAMKALGLSLNPDNWGVTVWEAGPTMVDVHRNPANSYMYGAPSGTNKISVPLPSNAYAPSGADGHVVVIDKAGGCMWDLFAMRKDSSGRWIASGAQGMPYPSIGYHPESHTSARGSGIHTLLGIIRPDEIAAGRIPHAIAFFFQQGITYVESRTNQASGNSSSPPNGARFYLPKSVDVNSITPDRVKRIIGVCLQEFGLILVDGSPNAAMQHAVIYKGQTMASVTGTTGQLWFSEFIDYLKLEKIPPTVPKGSEPAVVNRCTIWG